MPAGLQRKALLLSCLAVLILAGRDGKQQLGTSPRACLEGAGRASSSTTSRSNSSFSSPRVDRKLGALIAGTTAGAAARPHIVVFIFDDMVSGLLLRGKPTN